MAVIVDAYADVAWLQVFLSEHVMIRASSLRVSMVRVHFGQFLKRLTRLHLNLASSPAFTSFLAIIRAGFRVLLLILILFSLFHIDTLDATASDGDDSDDEDDNTGDQIDELHVLLKEALPVLLFSHSSATTSTIPLASTTIIIIVAFTGNSIFSIIRLHSIAARSNWC